MFSANHTGFSIQGSRQQDQQPNSSKDMIIGLSGKLISYHSIVCSEVTKLNHMHILVRLAIGQDSANKIISK